MISLHAPWHQTSLLLEAFDFFAAKKDSNLHLDLIQQSISSDISTPEKEFHLARQIASGDAFKEASLSLHISSRLSAPKLEMISATTLEALSVHGSEILERLEPCFALVNGRVCKTPAEIDQALSSGAPLESGISLVVDDFDVEINRGAPDTLPLVHLVGSPTTDQIEFEHLWTHIHSLIHANSIRAIYRPIPVPVREDSRDIGRGVGLQGYSVELQIKNMEYSVLDDRTIDHGSDGAAENLGLIDENLEDDENIEVDGFNFKVLIERRPDLAGALRKFKSELLSASKIEDDSMSVWKIKDLSMQASAQAIKSRDVLVAVRELSQNFPVWASPLSRTRIPEDFKAEVQSNQQRLAPGKTSLTLNNRIVHPTNWTASYLLEYLESQRMAHSRLTSFGIDASSARALLRKAGDALESQPRLDLRGFSRIPLNDLSRDSMYQGGLWARSVSDAMQGEGEIRFIAQNLYVVTLLVDPVAPMGVFAIGQTALRLIRNGAPVQIKIALVPDLATPPSAPTTEARNRYEASIKSASTSGASEIDLAEFLKWSDCKFSSAEQPLPAHCTTESSEPSSSSKFDENSLGSASMRACVAVEYLSRNHPQGVIEFFTNLLSKTRGQSEATSSQVLAAFTSTLPRSRQANAREILNKELQSGESLRGCVENRERSKSSGVGANDMTPFMNGFAMPQHWDMALIHFLRMDQPLIRDMVASGTIQDNTDIESVVLDAAPLVSSLNPTILESSIETVTFTESPHGLSVDGDVKYFMNKPQSQPVKSTTIHLCVDLARPDSVGAIERSIQFLESKSGMDSRIAILNTNPNAHLDCVVHNTCALLSVLSALIEHSTTQSILPPTLELSKFRTFLKSILVASTTGVASALQLIRNSVNSFGIPELSNDKNLLEFKSTKLLLKTPAFEQVSRIITWAGIPERGSAVVVNGRKLRNFLEFTVGDLMLLKDLESVASGRGAAVEALLESNDIPTAQISDAIMKVNSEFARISRLVKGPRADFQKDLNTELSSKSWNEHSSSCIVDAVASVDPVSIDAHRLVSILMLLRDHFACPLQVILNPSQNLAQPPLNAFYRHVLSGTPTFTETGLVSSDVPAALFSNLPTEYVLTAKLHTPESWFVELTDALYDLDNLQLDAATNVQARFQLSELVVTGHVEAGPFSPKGLQLILGTAGRPVVTDTLVMDNLNYFQLKARPGKYLLRIAPGRASSIFEISSADSVSVVVSSFGGAVVTLPVQKKSGKEHVELLAKGPEDFVDDDDERGGFWSSITSLFGGDNSKADSDDTIHIFSIASGHLYERFLKIMMLSVVRNTKSPVKFWLLRNFLSPAFKQVLPNLAKSIGFKYELVTYQWPSWLHQQTEKQRIIWGLKILFLDVLFPIRIKKIIYIDADQTVYGDVKELWDLNLRNRPYAYVPFCDSNPDTEGYRFWKQGYWANHLRGLKYHISALSVIDLQKFRRYGAGDTLRILYEQLSKDPNSLSNLDQDLPNYAQHMVPIFSLPQEWLWCETWCSQATKSRAKTIDLCNNPMTKRPKLDAAREIVGQDWIRYDNEIREIEDRGGRAGSNANNAEVNGAAHTEL
eukprot:c18604_g1_i2.p1 GENE.c18604_g1_i2~~c18604_g1_i2.p1  ORF type:complete len:1607 (+),score=401.77 c18604_g1_i2:98-4822(+)